MSGPWDFAGQGRGAHAAVDPWGRSFSVGGGGSNDFEPALMNGSGSWNQESGHASAQNGWGGGHTRNVQQSQQHMHADHRISHYVIGLPAEIIDQVRLVALTHAATCRLSVLPGAVLRSQKNHAGPDYGHVVYAPKYGLVGDELQQHRVFRRRTAPHIHVALPGSILVIARQNDPSFIPFFHHLHNCSLQWVVSAMPVAHAQQDAGISPCAPLHFTSVTLRRSIPTATDLHACARSPLRPDILIPPAIFTPIL
jgi:hypothetical protein